jgi:amino acid permease
MINSYTMIAVCPLLFIAWKVLKRSKFYKPEEVDLVKNLDEIEEYEANYVPRPAKYVISSPSKTRTIQCFSSLIRFTGMLLRGH